METLNKAQIKVIDNHLKEQGVKFMDVRLELMDHLASEFEENSEYVFLEDFLSEKHSLIKEFEKKRRKSMHWGYQRRLWKRLFMFISKPKYIIMMLMVFGVLYYAFNFLPSKTSIAVVILFLVMPQALQFVVYYRPSKMYRRVQSFQYILSIMSLPSIFLYVLHPIEGWLLPENQLFFIGYCFIATIFNLAGIIEVYQIKKELLKQYHHLIYA